MSTVHRSPIRRPLSAGELLDRSLTVLAAHWVTILVVVAIAQLPLAIIDILYARSLNGLAALMQTTNAQHISPFPAILASLGGTQAVTGFASVFVLTLVILAPLSFAAVIYATSRSYDGEPVELGGAVGFGFRRGPALILNGIVLGVCVGIASVIGFAVILLLSILVGFAAGLFSGGNARVTAAIIGVVVGVFAAVVVFVFIAALWVFLGTASVTAVLETPNPFTVIARSSGRIFNRREILRTILLGFALGFVTLVLYGIGALVSTAALSVTHLDALQAIIMRVLTIALTAFQYVFITLYYRDVRLRREGEDVLPEITHIATVPV